MDNNAARRFTAGLVGVVVLALAAGLALPVEAYLGGVALLVALAAAVIILSVQLDRPFVGFALLVVAGVAFPLEFRGPGAGMVSSPLPLAALICGVWLVNLLITRRVTPIHASRVVYAAMALIAVAFLAFAISQAGVRPGGAPLGAQVAELGIFVLSPCLFLAVGHQLTSLKHLKALTWLLVGAGVITIAFQMTPALAPLARYTTRPGSVGSLFWTWVIAVAVAHALFNRELPGLIRLSLAGVTFAALFHGLVNVRSWASGWVPAVIGLSVILLFRLPRTALGVGLAAVPVGLFFWDSLAGVLLADEQYSVLTRGEAFRVLWRLVEQSPLIGTGFGNYYYQAQNFPILGWYVPFVSHNNYQDILLQTGLIGLLAFLWFAIEILVLAVRSFQILPEGFPRAYAIGAVGGLAGSLAAGMLGDWIIPFYYNGGILGFRSSLLFWVFLGGLLSLRRCFLTSPEAVPARASGLADLPAPYRPAVSAH